MRSIINKRNNFLNKHKSSGTDNQYQNIVIICNYFHIFIHIFSYFKTFNITYNYNLN